MCQSRLGDGELLPVGVLCESVVLLTLNHASVEPVCQA